jgi:hypothetical protein
MPPSHPPSEIAPIVKVLCLGCGRAFSHFGRISHLAQTRNPPCRKIASQERTTQANSPAEISESIFEETPTPDGDFFGAYDEDEMPWPRWHATDLDADDEEDALMDDAGGPPSSIADSQDMDDEDDPGEGGSGNSDEEDVVHKEGGTGANEDHVVIETFPSQYGDAGVVMERGSGSLYKKYNNNCLQDSKDNMYAPFKSKLDWDFAQWAKLRGPGSTAINELLNIDGVSIMMSFPTYLWLAETYRGRCLNDLAYRSRTAESSTNSLINASLAGQSLSGMT